MTRFGTLVELKAALLDLNQRKGVPLNSVKVLQQSSLKFTATRDFGPFKRQFSYQRSPYEVLEILKGLPDVKPGYNWSLLGRFL